MTRRQLFTALRAMRAGLWIGGVGGGWVGGMILWGGIQALLAGNAGAGFMGLLMGGLGAGGGVALVAGRGSRGRDPQVPGAAMTRIDSVVCVDRAGRIAAGCLRQNFPRGASSGDGWTAMRRVGKKRAGRTLDGRTWNQLPQ